MICGDPVCGCAIDSLSLQIDGSGAPGDPWQIESNAFAIVTSATRPGTPFTGQFILETDTRRIRYWDGTYWRIVGGDFPTFNIQRQSSLTLPTSGTEATVTLPTEVLDSDNFHTSTNGFITIPAGYGGEYMLVAGATFEANATGFRRITMAVTSNTTPAAQSDPISGGFQMESTTSNGLSLARTMFLEAGAVVTLKALQTSGGALDVLLAQLQGFMIRHVPELT